MENDYDPGYIPLTLRKTQFSKDQIIAVLNLAIEKKQKVALVNKNYSISNRSWHIPLEVIPEQNLVVLKWGTTSWHIITRYIQSL